MIRSWVERSFRNRIFLTVLLAALVPLLLCDVLMTRVMIARSEHALGREAQQEMAQLEQRLDELLGQCTDAAVRLTDSTVTRSALRRGGDDSRILYQLLYRDTVSLRDYADFEVYDEAGSCLYTTAAAFPADRSADWGVLRAARQGTDTVLRAESGGLTGARTVTRGSRGKTGVPSGMA